jgi:hypothetical protein
VKLREFLCYKGFKHGGLAHIEEAQSPHIFGSIWPECYPFIEDQRELLLEELSPDAAIAV